MKLIIAGSRHFDDYEFLEQIVDAYIIQAALGDNTGHLEIVSGAQRTWSSSKKKYYGADYLGEKYAQLHNIPVTKFYAKWTEFGKGAGYRRNLEMAKYATHCIVFWNGISKGSKMMIELAEEHKLPTTVIKY